MQDYLLLNSRKVTKGLFDPHLPGQSGTAKNQCQDIELRLMVKVITFVPKLLFHVGLLIRYSKSG
jgi:hypothetical protein